jgi:hypothetical protein
MKVRNVAESICLEESHRMYKWVLEVMCEIEPRFTMQSVDIIFADQILTQLFTDSLGGDILLRGDYYHLMNEVFPEHFGQNLYQKLRPLLDVMLTRGRDEWEQAYQQASIILRDNAEKHSYVSDIHDNPKYYSAWYLSSVEGNLKMNGSVPAEQNHSSIIAHLGNGASWSITEHTNNLIRRQVHLTSKRRQEDDSRFVQTRVYKSCFGMDEAGDDELAKRTFSKFGYESLFLPALKKKRKLLFCTADNGDHIVYPAGENNDCETSTLVPLGQRCQCRMRLAFNFQCEHEMCIDGKLILDKCHSRWLSQRCYDTQAPTSSLQTLNQQENPEDPTFHDASDAESENDEVDNQVLNQDVNDTGEETSHNLGFLYRGF